MKKLIIASNNEHKIKEIKAILSEFPIDIISLKEAGINIDIEEDGTTFIENAYKKASEIFKIKKDCMVLSDDSGLSVDALGGAPGVYSARFAGEHGNDEKNNKKLLSLLKGKSFDERKAKFISAIVLIIDENTVIKVQGEVEGYIKEEPAGEKGFGYDPLFYFPKLNKTFAQMSEEEKNSVSHRAKALRKLQEELRKYYK
ncbi:XTP/dITP diphosphohydrolase [Clostridium sp. USBA 49]|jgi:XTP/dITP diphosphohydrolase|uniref:XTP/dITP diphosphatase n=1 Tax=Clostridium TaxID=1485 RepID=UPI00099A1EF6|nr:MULTISPECIES: XTP/dITP diphosphatase [Clostridium]SKA79771.1 XTP/dITP diphosphohydrolase [Clostridium sp. USBA 49]